MKSKQYIGRIPDGIGGRFDEVVGAAIIRYPENFQTYQTTRGPRESNRVFPTLAHAQAYINDLLNTDGTIHEEGDGKTLVKSAFPGIILTVVNDKEENNGAYLVININPKVNPGLGLKRLDVNPIPDNEIKKLFNVIGWKDVFKEQL